MISIGCYDYCVSRNQVNSKDRRREEKTEKVLLRIINIVPCSHSIMFCSLFPFNKEVPVINRETFEKCISRFGPIKIAMVSLTQSITCEECALKMLIAKKKCQQNKSLNVSFYLEADNVVEFLMKGVRVAGRQRGFAPFDRWVFALLPCHTIHSHQMGSKKYLCQSINVVSCTKIVALPTNSIESLTLAANSHPLCFMVWRLFKYSSGI